MRYEKPLRKKKERDMKNNKRSRNGSPVIASDKGNRSKSRKRRQNSMFRGRLSSIFELVWTETKVV